MIELQMVVIYVAILCGTAIIAAGVMKFKRKAKKDKNHLDPLR